MTFTPTAPSAIGRRSLLQQLPEEQAEEVPAMMPSEAQPRQARRRCPPRPVGRRRVRRVPPTLTMTAARAFLPRLEPNLQVANHLCIVDASRRLIGMVALRELLTAPPGVGHSFSARQSSIATSVTSLTSLHSTPGRLRIRARARRGDERFSRWMELEFGQIPGVTRVQANPLTGSVLILFDPHRVSDQQILRQLGRMGLAAELNFSAPRPVPEADPVLPVGEVAAKIGAALAKELVKAVLAHAARKSPFRLLLALW